MHVDRHRLHRLATAACLAAGLAAPPLASAGTVEFTARESANHLYYFGGFAISGDEGADGAPPPSPGDLKTPVLVTGFASPTLAIAGSDHHDIRYLSWSGFLDESWAQTQTFQVQAAGADVWLDASGSSQVSQTSQVCSALTGCGLASELHWTTNAQSLDFRLDAATAIALSGATSGGQWVDVLLWSEAGQRFNTLIAGFNTTQNVSFDLQRTLQPGLYRIRNNTSRFTEGGATDVDHAWAYRLTLTDSQLVGAVPEPGAGALLALGLAGLAWQRRSRRR